MIYCLCALVCRSRLRADIWGNVAVLVKYLWRWARDCCEANHQPPRHWHTWREEDRGRDQSPLRWWDTHIDISMYDVVIKPEYTRSVYNTHTGRHIPHIFHQNTCSSHRVVQTGMMRTDYLITNHVPPLCVSSAGAPIIFFHLFWAVVIFK